MEVIQHAFQFLDVRKSQSLLLQELFVMYKAQNHPKSRARQKSAEELKQDFVASISKKRLLAC